MKKLALLTFLFLNQAFCGQPTPDVALTWLIDGNKHFASGNVTHKFYSAEARDKMLEHQTPFAAIVGCSDSRVPPEIVFDRGLGELFVVRDAGNVVGPIEMDSVEFAVEHLKVPLVMVLGHQNCGAVKAATLGKNYVPELDTIFPIIDGALKKCDMIGANHLTNAIYCNVKNSVETLKKSPTIAPYLEKKQVRVVGAYYELDTGKVILIGD